MDLARRRDVEEWSRSEESLVSKGLNNSAAVPHFFFPFAAAAAASAAFLSIAAMVFRVRDRTKDVLVPDHLDHTFPLLLLHDRSHPLPFTLIFGAAHSILVFFLRFFYG